MLESVQFKLRVGSHGVGGAFNTWQILALLKCSNGPKNFGSPKWYDQTNLQDRNGPGAFRTCMYRRQILKLPLAGVL